MIEFYLFISLGVLLTVFAAFDFFYTTLSFRGAGPLTKTVTNIISSVFLFANRRTGRRIILSFSGVAHILILTCLWIGLLWIGFFLILSSSEISIVHTSTSEPANWVNRLYFSGYILTTLGNGDFKPTNGAWQMVVVVFSFSGFIFITTTISYLVNVASAVLDKRTLSLFISNLGKSAEEIVINTYSGGSFSRLVRLIPHLQKKINRLNQNHYAYPLSHYFASLSTEDSLPVNLFNLDEALTIIKYQVDKDPSVEDDIRPLRNAIRNFLITIETNFVTEFQHDKKLAPNREKLKAQNISLIDEPSFSEEDTSTIQQRRYLFYGFLKSNGWNLDDIHLDHIKSTEVKKI